MAGAGDTEADKGGKQMLSKAVNSLNPLIAIPTAPPPSPTFPPPTSAMEAQSSNTQARLDEPDIQYMGMSINGLAYPQQDNPQQLQIQQLQQIQQIQQQQLQQQHWQNSDPRAMVDHSSNHPPRPPQPTNHSQQLQSAPAPMIDAATFNSLPPAAIQYIQALITDRDTWRQHFHNLREKAKADFVKLQDQRAHEQGQHTAVVSRVNEYKEANDAYCKEHNRSLAKIKELNQEVEKQRMHANQGWQSSTMWKSSYDEINQKLTTTKAELESATILLNQAHLDITQWKNCVAAWSDRGGEYQTRLAHQMREEAEQKFAARDKAASEKIMQLEIMLRHQHAKMTNSTRLPLPESSIQQPSTSPVVVQPPQFAGQLPSAVPAAADANLYRRHSIPMGFTARQMPPPINTATTAPQMAGSSETTVPSRMPVTASPSTSFSTPSGMINAVANMSTTHVVPSQSSASGSTSLPCTPVPGSGSHPQLGSRPGTSQGVALRNIQPASHPGLALPPRPSTGDATTRPRQSSAPGIPTAQVNGPGAPSAPPQPNRSHTESFTPKLSLPSRPQSGNLPHRLSASSAASGPSTPKGHRGHPQQASPPSAPVVVTLAPRLRPAKRQSEPIKTEEIDQLMDAHNRERATKKARGDDGRARLTASAVASASGSGTLERMSSTRASSPDEPLASSNVSRLQTTLPLPAPPIAVLEPPQPSPKPKQELLMEVEITLPDAAAPAKANPQVVPPVSSEAVADGPDDFAELRLALVTAQEPESVPAVDASLPIDVEMSGVIPSPQLSSIEPGEVGESDVDLTLALPALPQHDEPEEGEIVKTPQTMVNEFPAGSSSNMDVDTKHDALVRSLETSPAPRFEQSSITPPGPIEDEEAEEPDSKLFDFLATVFDTDDSNQIFCQLCINRRMKQETPEPEDLLGELLTADDLDTLVKHCKERHSRAWELTMGDAA